MLSSDVIKIVGHFTFVIILDHYVYTVFPWLCPYRLFIASFLKPMTWSLYLGSVLVGLGAGGTVNLSIWHKFSHVFNSILHECHLM